MQVEAPSFTTLAMEPVRAGLSLIMGLAGLSAVPHHQRVGHGEPIMVLPGLGMGEHSTALMRKYLRALGYEARDWGLGVNTGPRGGLDSLLDDLEQQLGFISYLANRQKVTLLGWSLGGVLARELAKRCPDRVEQVITMGTPLTGDPDATNAKRLYRILSGMNATADQDLLDRIKVAPPVPCVSIYSQMDGVVAWEACVSDEAGHTKGVEVEGVSHLSMMTHPEALQAVARELAARFA